MMGSGHCEPESLIANVSLSLPRVGVESLRERRVQWSGYNQRTMRCQSFKSATFQSILSRRRTTTRWCITRLGGLGRLVTARHWRLPPRDYTSSAWLTSTLETDNWRSSVRPPSTRLTNAPARLKPLWIKQDKQGHSSIRWGRRQSRLRPPISADLLNSRQVSH